MRHTLRSWVATFVALLLTFGASATTYSILPAPTSIRPSEGIFRLTYKTPIRIEKGLENPAERFIEDVAPIVSLKAPRIHAKRADGIHLALDATLHAEGYRMQITPHAIHIAGGSEAGVYYALQSLRQLIVQHRTAIPCCEVEDQPNFAYRGAHMDVVRHFFTVEEVKRYLDILAAHKLNRLHWHLTDDQGWRIEIKRYPELTEHASKRKETLIGHCLRSTTYDGIPYGPYFFTQEEIRDIVRYAAERYITIIPEIEMPSHAQAALHALPWLGCEEQQVEVWTHWGVSPEVMCGGKETTYEFLENVLTEVIDLFPSEYIHIGGDECPKERWEECEHCQARIRELGLKDESETRTAENQLQSYLTGRIERFLAKHGRRIIGWDDILAGGVSPEATVMSWQGSKGGIYAAKHGNLAIMTPMDYCYFDFYQTKSQEGEGLAIGGWVSFEKVYGWNPYEGLTADEQPYIYGLQCNLWSEYITSFDHLQRMLLPRLAALSEVQWATDRRNPATIRARMEQMRRLYKLYGWSYAPYYFEGRE